MPLWWFETPSLLKQSTSIIFNFPIFLTVTHFSSLNGQTPDGENKLRIKIPFDQGMNENMAWFQVG